MRYLIFLVLSLYVSALAANEQPDTSTVVWEERRTFEGSQATQTLRVLSNTDTAIFAPIINSFLATEPRVNVEYLVAGSSEIYEEFKRSPERYDVVISSAMDLQFKLVNDGYAQQIEDFIHPGWAQWHSSLFGFTLEPAAIVVNRQLFSQLPIPRSRQEMINVLRENSQAFKGRIGTYDIRQSGLGYLFATQDARSSETYWRLMEIMGGLEARLYCCSSEMINDVANGTIAIAYNVLGSYAQARDDLAGKIEVVLPSDFPTTMMRTAFVSGHSRQTESASSFIRFLASSRWKSKGSNPRSLPPMRSVSDNSEASVIALGPGLMIFLDSMKRQAFVQEWEDAVIQ